MRRATREVMVGKVGVGGKNPIRIQSMTTSDTKDVAATVAQIMKLADHGCEIARVTVQGLNEAKACEEIKNSLISKGYEIPLVADIHFFPKAAMSVADFSDKVRINPGNYVDPRARFIQKDFDEDSYQKELNRIDEKFSPLVLKLKKLGKPLRIGTNHGSLSDRIMNRYGDTPEGMVESALEYTRVCRKYDYHDIIFSMKASNTAVMIEAYRQLVKKLDALGWNYPLHLGVTEAGEGEDGRVKSAIGTGSLLLDGIGDTIRVSLTEDPWEEIDPCKRLAALANHEIGEYQLNTFQKPKPSAVLHRDGSVILKEKTKRSDAHLTEHALIADHLHLKRFNLSSDSIEAQKFSLIQSEKVAIVNKESWEVLKDLNPSCIIYKGPYNTARKFYSWLSANALEIPVFWGFEYAGQRSQITIQAAAECGSLLVDGLGDGLAIQTPYDVMFEENLSFAILQGSRRRTTKTEFISCPGCGRTLFNLQEVAAKIREKTAHLPGVKIGIMGCIVNGPGEMADADFGYVGSKPGLIDLYVGKECVEKNVPFESAELKLIDLIKAYDRWVEPVAKNSTTC